MSVVIIKRLVMLIICLAGILIIPGEQDDAGVYERIVIFGPNLVEIVFALEKGDSVAAVDSFTHYPPEVEELRRSGTLSHPNLEVITDVKADLVLIQGDNRVLQDFCRKQQIHYRSYRLEGLKGILDGIKDIGRLVGKEEQAVDYARTLQEKLERTGSIKRENNPRVLFSLGGLNSELNITTVSGQSFLSELLDIAGGINIFQDVSVPYPQVSMEEILTENPDMIFEILPGRDLTSEQRRQRLQYWERFKVLSAVRDSQIYFLTDDYLLIPGPRVIKTLRRFQEIISQYNQSDEDEPL